MKLFGGINEVAQLNELKSIPKQKIAKFDKSKFIPHENYRDGDIPLSDNYLTEEIVHSNNIPQHHFNLEHLEIIDDFEFRSDLEY